MLKSLLRTYDFFQRIMVLLWIHQSFPHVLFQQNEVIYPHSIIMSFLLFISICECFNCYTLHSTMKCATYLLLPHVFTLKFSTFSSPSHFTSHLGSRQSGIGSFGLISKALIKPPLRHNSSANAAAARTSRAAERAGRSLAESYGDTES